MIDELILWLRALGISAAIAVLVTWYPVALGALSKDARRIHHMALGIALVALGNVSIGTYSFIMREFEIDLRQTAIAIFVVVMNVVGMFYLAISYYREGGSNSLPRRMLGMYYGVGAFLVIAAYKLLN